MNKPVRIAHIIGTMPGGGVKNVVFNYYRNIDRDRYQFDIFYDAKTDIELPQDLIDMGMRFYRIPNHMKVVDCYKCLREYFKENKYQIIHSHMNTLSFVSLYAAYKENIPVRIVHNHSVPGGGEYIKHLIKDILRVFSKKYANTYFACSDKAANYMYGTTDNVYIMRNAVDYDRFKVINSNRIDELKNKYDLKDKFVIGNVGRLTYAKNQKFLIDIFKELKNRNIKSKLLFVGDGELKDELSDYINKLDLNDDVIITGNVDGVEDYYHLLDIMVLPSVFEGLPLTAIEAQAAHVPLLASDSTPNEAIISSSGARIIDINSSVDTWIDNIIDVSKQEVIFNDNSENYIISNCCNKLMDEYDSLLTKYGLL